MTILSNIVKALYIVGIIRAGKAWLGNARAIVGVKSNNLPYQVI